MDDCFDLGKVAYLEADYYHTELWMAQALSQLEQGEASTAVDTVTVLDYLSYSVYQQGELDRALQFTKRLLELGQSAKRSPSTSLAPLSDLTVSVHRPQPPASPREPEVLRVPAGQTAGGGAAGDGGRS